MSSLVGKPFSRIEDFGSYNEMFYELLWFNPEIKIDKKSVLFKDILILSNELLSNTELKNRVNTIINFIQL